MATTHTATFIFGEKTYTYLGDLVSGNKARIVAPNIEMYADELEDLTKFMRHLGQIGFCFGDTPITSLVVTWNDPVFDMVLNANGTEYTFHSNLAITGVPSFSLDSTLPDTNCGKIIIRTVNLLSKLGKKFGTVITSLNVAATP